MADSGRQAVVRATLWGPLSPRWWSPASCSAAAGSRTSTPALVPYAGATVFSAFGLGYRYTHVAAAAADAPLLVPRLAALPARRGACPRNLLPPRAALLGQLRRAEVHRAPLARCAGRRTGSSSGAACSRRRSPSRCSSAGSASRRRATRRRSTWPTSSASASFRFPLAAAGAAALPRPRHRRGAGARRHRAVAVAADARPRRAGGAAVRHGLPAADPALRDLGHRPAAHRLDALAARLPLRLPRHSTRSP